MPATRPRPAAPFAARGTSESAYDAAGVRALPLPLRPRERLRERGARELSDADLLAILLRTGTPTHDVLELAALLVRRFHGAAGVDRASVDELCGVPGLGPAKAVELKAAFELGRRAVTLDPGLRPQVRSPQDIVNLVYADMCGLEQEHLRVLLLDTKNRVQRIHELYRGTLNSTSVRVSELFKEAVRANAAAVALVHNHPSGDPTPSPQDVALTAEAQRAGDLLDIELLDHVVVGRGPQSAWASLREQGLGFVPARRAG